MPSFATNNNKTFIFQFFNSWECVYYISNNSFEGALKDIKYKMKDYNFTNWRQVISDVGPKQYSNDAPEFDDLNGQFETPDDLPQQ